ncbi:interference hedgehog-like [Anopheles cruzii]|uniref:interference hedgehog-like n=1 Tax=Anopheles cruzii TaxID=68878 RepID=UPI0022EC85A9|nr:interference hedgehog-like [Anopheles cruzii]
MCSAVHDDRFGDGVTSHHCPSTSQRTNQPTSSRIAPRAALPVEEATTIRTPRHRTSRTAHFRRIAHGWPGGLSVVLLLCLALSDRLWVTLGSPAQSYPPSSSATTHHTHHHAQQQQHHHQARNQGAAASGDEHPHNHHHHHSGSSAPGSSQSRSNNGGGPGGSSSSSSGIGVYMIRSPESTIAPADDEVLFECELNLVPERLEWRFRAQGTPGNRKDYVYIGKNQSGYNVSTVDGRFKLRVSVSDGTIGEYQCVAWFGASAIASIPARLTLATIGPVADQADMMSVATGGGRYPDPRSPTMMRRVLPTIPQQHFKVYPGNSIIVDCGEIVSNPPPIWSYYKDGITIYPNVTQLQPGRRLILAALTQRDSGTYWCSALNSITGNEVILPQKTTVQVDYVARSEPRAISRPVNVSALPGDTALLECPGIGNPVPVPSWTRANGIPLNARARIQDYGLQLSNVHPEDDGVYLCRLQNGIEPALTHAVRLTVLEPPKIIAPPRSTLTNESDSLELECVARGSPRPEIYWMINGDYTKWDALIRSNGSRMVIQSVEKRHAGIVQCFARNAVGEASEGNLLQVNPKQIPGGLGTAPLGSVPSGAKVGGEHSPKRKGGKKHKHLVMIPPSRPNITRLSDESVMVRWSVPSSDGLPIQFFKVQYRMLGDPAKNVARTQWMTENEDIPPYTRSYEVNNLKSDHLYRFRIVAVYSNNDNKEGAASGKFHLQRGSQLGLTKSHLLAPTLTRIEPVSQQAVVLHWQFPLHLPHPIDGFYAYYRAATTAGEYSKATVDSSTARHFKIDHLEPGTAYEFKLQSFTAAAASDFSAILTGRTLKPPTPPPTVPTVIAASEGADGRQEVPNYMLVVACLLIVTGLIVLLLCCCIGRRKKRGHGADETDAKVHIPVDQNGFAGPVSNGGARVHHKTRANGMNGRMNITPNPLAQDGDKNRTVMELRFLPNTLVEADHDRGASLPGGAGGWRRKKAAAAAAAASSPQSPPPEPAEPEAEPERTDGGPAVEATVAGDGHGDDHDNNDDDNDATAATAAMNSCGVPMVLGQQQPHPPPEHLMLMSLPHRRTLERGVRTMANGGTQYDQKMMLEAEGGGGPPARNSSIRRARRGSGSVPGSPRIGRGPSSELLHQQQGGGSVTVTRSPMPMRAAAGVKRGAAAARLGRAENMSSGSLNSIEV